MLKDMFINLTLPSKTKSFFYSLYESSMLLNSEILPGEVVKAEILPSFMLLLVDF